MPNVPIPEAHPDLLRGFLAQFDPELQELAERLRALAERFKPCRWWLLFQLGVEVRSGPTRSKPRAGG